MATTYTQVLPHNRYQLAPELIQKVHKLFQQWEQDTLEYLVEQPEVSASYYETLGRILKEYKDVETAICDGQAYKTKYEISDLIRKTAGEYVKALPLLRIV